MAGQILRQEKRWNEIPGGVLQAESLQEEEKAQKEAIIRALKRHNGKRRDAARELFISERTLYRKIKELGIDEIP